MYWSRFESASRECYPNLGEKPQDHTSRWSTTEYDSKWHFRTQRCTKRGRGDLPLHCQSGRVSKYKHHVPFRQRWAFVVLYCTVKPKSSGPLLPLPSPFPFPPIRFLFPPSPPLFSIRPDLFFNVLTYSINTTMVYSKWTTWNCFLSRQTLTNIPTSLPIRCLLYKHRYEFLWRYEVFSVMPKNTVEMKERLCGLKKKGNNDYILGFEHLRISHNISKVDGVTWNSRTNIFWGRGGESDQKLNQLGGENSLLMVRSNTYRQIIDNSGSRSHNLRVQTKRKLNPLTPKSDQDRISPYNINIISSRQV